jgi:hypothetical protein
MKDISMNFWDKPSRDEHISGRKLEYPEKNIRNEEIMKRVRLDFVILTRQRDK